MPASRAQNTSRWNLCNSVGLYQRRRSVAFDARIPHAYCSTPLMRMADSNILASKRSGTVPSLPLRLATLFTAVLAFPLVWLGGLVTSHAAGLAVPDWPNSFGYNMFALPWDMWLGPYAGGTFYEHSHRLLGSAVGLAAFVATMIVWSPSREHRWRRIWAGTTIASAILFVVTYGIAAWVRGTGRVDEKTYKIFTHVFSGFAGLAVMAFIAWRCRAFREPNRLRRWTVTLVLALVILQGLIGGSRVTEVSLWLARIHGVLGQLTFATAAVVAAVCSAWWARAKQLPSFDGKTFRRLVTACVALICLQLVLGALMRHDPRRTTGSYDGAAGLAIPDWPLHYGKLIPPTSQADLDTVNVERATELQLQPVTLGQVWLHISHRLGAYMTAIVIFAVAAIAFIRHRDQGALLRPASLLAVLVVIQLTLGVYTVLKRKPADIATAHQATGALLLMTASVLLARTIRVYSFTGIRREREVSEGFTSGTFVGPTIA
jgi:heme a synthase